MRAARTEANGDAATTPAAVETPSAAEIDRDAALMMRARDGDDGAFQELFERHHRVVFNFCLRMLGDPSRAEELMQDAFVNIFRARHRYEPRSRFLTYLLRVATNLCLNEKRSRARWGTPLDIEGPAGEGILDTKTASVEDTAIQSERLGRVRAAIDELPGRQAAALLLTRVDGLAHAEVAESLGVSTEALKSLVFRATQTLRRSLRAAEEIATLSAMASANFDVAAPAKARVGRAG